MTDSALPRASKWLQVPTKEEIVELLKIDLLFIECLSASSDGTKFRVLLTQTIAPKEGNLKNNNWDYRVFPTAMYGAKIIAFFQVHHVYGVILMYLRPDNGVEGAAVGAGGANWC